jgi:hypothetical protein
MFALNEYWLCNEVTLQILAFTWRPQNQMGHRFLFSGYFSLTSFGGHLEVPVSQDQSFEFLTKFSYEVISHTCVSFPTHS